MSRILLVDDDAQVRKMLKKTLPSDIHDKVIILMDRRWRRHSA